MADGRASFVLAALAGTLAIACVATPFAVVGQRHAPRPPSAAPVTRTEAPLAVAAAPSLDAGAPASAAPVVHTFRVADLAGQPGVQIVSGTVGRRPFLAALAAAGVAPTEAHRVLVAFSGVRNLDRCDAKDTFTVAKAADAHVIAFELAPHGGGTEDDSLVLFQAREDEQSPGKLAAKRVEIAVEHEHVAIGVVVGDDLRTSIARAHPGEGNEQILSLVDDALDGHAELSDLHAGTRLKLLATEDRIEGKFTGISSLDAVEYAPAGKPTLRIYWFPKGSSQPAPHSAKGHGPDRSERRGGFYDAQGRQPYHGGWRSPVPMARISSRFNPNRMHPVLHVIMPHNGIDFAAPPGTPIYAAASGVVKSAGDSGPCGNMVQIDHPNGLTSAYCHMSRFAAGLAPGQHVETRQLIGYVGQTGRATGPHLHFAVKRGEMFLDPLTMKLDGVRLVPPKLKTEFDDLRQKLDHELDAIDLPEQGDAGVAAKPDAQAPHEDALPDEPQER